MAKLYFYHGAMGSSKTATALMTRYNYQEKGKSPLLLKPSIDTRDGENIVYSRIGLQAPCILVEDLIQNYSDEMLKQYDVLIIDECQFLTPAQVEYLAHIVDDLSIPVICYGLKTDFTSHLFPGSQRLLELADQIQEIPTMCWCGHKAHYNARIINGKITYTGEQIMLGANESYVSLCRKHYLQGKINGDNNDEYHYDQQAILQLLDSNHIDYTIIEHEHVETIDAIEVLNLPNSEYIVKNLFLRDDKKRNYYLVTLQKDKQANLKELRTRIQSRPLSFANSDDLANYLALQPGSVTPFGLLNDVDHKVTFVIDNDCLNQPLIAIHPNTNIASLWLKPSDLIKLLENNGQTIVTVTI